MKTLSTRQAELIGRSARARIPIVKLTTYTDRAAKTGAESFYFSDRALKYDYGNTGSTVECWPFLVSLGTLEASMPHLPDPGIALPLRSMTITLANSEYEYDSSRLITYLRTKNLEFALVEVAELDIDTQRGEDFVDASALVGDEHVVWFRGEVMAVPSITVTQIQLRCVTVHPGITWGVLVNAADNDPRDHGKRLPMPYGLAKRVPCLGVTVGWKTTLAQAIDATTTGNVKFSDCTGLSGSFTIRIAGEDIAATYVDATTLNLTARAQNSTTAAAHLNGTTAVEVIASAVYCPAGLSLSAVDAVWVRNPFSDEIVRVENTGLYSTNFSVSVGGVTGSTITFTAANLRSLLNTLEQQALVTAQPSVAVQPAYTINEEPAGGRVTQESLTIATSTGTPCDIVIAPNGEVDARIDGSGGAEEKVTFTWGGISDSRLISRWRYVVKYGVNTLNIVNGTDSNAGTVFLTGTSGLSYSLLYAKNVFTSGVFVFGSWVSAGGGATVASAINGKTLDFYCTKHANVTGWTNDGFWVRESDVEIEFELSASGITQTVNASNNAAVIAAAEFGYGLEFYADVQGPVASGGNYIAADGVVLLHPADIIRHRLAVLGGLGHSAIDATTFAVGNLPSTYRLAPELTELGINPEEIDARLAFETRANLVPEETASGTVWRLHAADTSHQFATPTVTIDEWADIEESGREGETIVTRIRTLYDRDRAIGASFVEDEFRAVLTTTANEAEYGMRASAAAIGLRAVANPTTATGVHNYYANELPRRARTLEIRQVPWWQGYALELGDTINATPPWSASALKLRVLKYAKNFEAETIDLGVTEVG